MARNILQGVAETLVGTITEVDVRHQIESIVIGYNEAMSYRSKELQESLLTFKTYLNRDNANVITMLKSTETDITKLQFMLDSLGAHTITSIADIIKKMGTQYKQYSRYNTITNLRIDHYGYTNTLSKVIGPNYVTYTENAISGFKTERAEKSGSKLHETKYLYFKDGMSEQLISMMNNSDRTFKDNYGLYHGLNSILSFDNNTIYIGENTTSNASSSTSLQSAVRASAITNIVLPDGLITIHGDVNIGKNLKVTQTLQINSTSTFNDDITINDGDIIIKDPSANTIFSLTSAQGVMELNKSFKIYGSYLSNTDDALTIIKGSISLGNGDINSSKGNMTLTKGNMTLAEGNLQLVSGSLSMNNGNFFLNGNQYIDNDNALYIMKSGATDGSSASSLINNSKIYVGQNNESVEVLFGTGSNKLLTADSNGFTITRPFTSTSTSGAFFGGTLTINQGLYLKNSGGNSTFYVESAGDIYGKSLDLSGDINAKTTTVTSLSASSLTVNGNAYTTGTFTVNGLVTLNSGMNITGVLSSSNSCHFEGTSYISGCSFTNGVMDGTATKARYADVAEYYTTDKEYEYGTVIEYSQHNIFFEGQEYKGGVVLGVVSHNPGTILNADLAEKDQPCNLIVLKSRSPVRLSHRSDPKNLIPGNVVVAYDKGEAIVISQTEYFSDTGLYSHRYIGRVLNPNIIDGRIEVKF